MNCVPANVVLPLVFFVVLLEDVQRGVRGIEGEIEKPRAVIFLACTGKEIDCIIDVGCGGVEALLGRVERLLVQAKAFVPFEITARS